MLTSKDLVAILIALVILIILIVQWRSDKSSRPPTTPLLANVKSGTESNLNKDRHPGGE